ncbi:hypothetical protein L9F63_000364, partial [Diploptera punctata]
FLAEYARILFMRILFCVIFLGCGMRKIYFLYYIQYHVLKFITLCIGLPLNSISKKCLQSSKLFYLLYTLWILICFFSSDH